MEEHTRVKPKTKASSSKGKAVAQKAAKKRKNDGPTCSMFLAEITRKLAMKKKQEAEKPPNIVAAIIESLTNALPIVVSRPTPLKKESSIKIEFVPQPAPEPVIKPIIVQPHKINAVKTIAPDAESLNPIFKMPKMPVTSSEVFKAAYDRNRRIMQRDAAINTSNHQDIAGEITKHVATLRKISMIAEEFNKKTARNLKEIVDSVQEDLMKKLEEIKAEQQRAVTFKHHNHKSNSREEI